MHEGQPRVLRTLMCTRDQAVCIVHSSRAVFPSALPSDTSPPSPFPSPSGDPGASFHGPPIPSPRDATAGLALPLLGDGYNQLPNLMGGFSLEPPEEGYADTLALLSNDINSMLMVSVPFGSPAGSEGVSEEEKSSDSGSEMNLGMDLGDRKYRPDGRFSSVHEEGCEHKAHPHP